MEVVRSLKTENQAEAIPLALMLAATYKTVLQDIQSGKKSVANFAELKSSLDDAAAGRKSRNIPPSLVSTDFIPTNVPAQAPMLSLARIFHQP